MLVTDSQVHIWGADTPDRPWPPGRAHMAQKPYAVTKDMLLKAMDEAGVELPWLSGSDLEGVMGRGVSEWLGWPEPR